MKGFSAAPAATPFSNICSRKECATSACTSSIWNRPRSWKSWTGAHAFADGDFQVFFVRGVKALYGRGKHDAEFAAIAALHENPNPDALSCSDRRPHQHPGRSAAHGDDRQGSLRAHPRDPGELCAIVELPGGRGRGRQVARMGGRAARDQDRCGRLARTGGLARRRYDDDLQ